MLRSVIPLNAFSFSPTKCADFHFQVLRKHCWMVLQDVVIYPSETPPSLGGPSRSSAGESTAGRMGRAGAGEARHNPGRRTPGTEEETEVRRGRQKEEKGKGKKQQTGSQGGRKGPSIRQADE